MTNAEAAAILDKLRTMLAVDDDGPEGAMGPRWVLKQVRELLAVPDGAHDYRTRELDGWTVCRRCGMVRNYDKETCCRGKLPSIGLRVERKAGG